MFTKTQVVSEHDAISGIGLTVSVWIIDLQLRAEQVPGLQSAQPDSQVETHLVDLLDFDKFALIKMLVQNRLKVVWCMRLNRAQNDEEHTRIQVHAQLSCVGHNLQHAYVLSAYSASQMMSQVALSMPRLCCIYIDRQPCTCQQKSRHWTIYMHYHGISSCFWLLWRVQACVTLANIHCRPLSVTQTVAAMCQAKKQYANGFWLILLGM